MHYYHLLRLAAFAGIFLSVAASAQTLEKGQTPAERLEQLEETYSSNLRKYHAPIIQEYLITLEKLKQTMSQRGQADRIVNVQAEIDRVKKINAGSGLLPYDSLETASRENTSDSPRATGTGTVKTARNNNQDAAILLTAASVKRFTHDLAKLSDKPDSRAVPVGAAEWQMDKIPAGDYRVSILYSCAGKPADSTIIARLGQISVPRAFTAANATGGINEFRIARLGDIRIENGFAGTSLVLQNSDPTIVAIWVREVIITKQNDTERK